MEKYEHMIEKWGKYEFSNEAITGSDFYKFAENFWIALNIQLPTGYEIVNWSIGHYIMSGFVTDGDDNYVYWSISDVRHFPGKWIKDILIRAAKDEEDYTGDSNASAPFGEFGDHVERLMEMQARRKESGDETY